MNAPFWSIAFAPTHTPPRTRCSKRVPSGYSHDGESSDTKLLPVNP
jgi:hypothetical protein